MAVRAKYSTKVLSQLGTKLPSLDQDCIPDSVALNTLFALKISTEKSGRGKYMIADVNIKYSVPVPLPHWEAPWRWSCGSGIQVSVDWTMVGYSDAMGLLVITRSGRVFTTSR